MENNYSVIRKYFMEFIVSTMIVAIGYLFSCVISLNKTIIDIEANQITKSNEVMYNNTQATNQFLNYIHYQKQ